MLSKSELLEIISSLLINTVYYCDNGPHEGSFRLAMHNPYIPTDHWDLLQEELREQRLRDAELMKKLLPDD